MNLSPVETAMIGDDLMTDISGSQEIGMTGMLVRTGKFRADTLKTSLVKPKYVIDSIVEVAKTL